MDGEPQEVVEAYLSKGHLTSARWEHPPDTACGTDVKIRAVEVVRAEGGSDAAVPFDEPIRLRFEHEVREPVHGLWLRMQIRDMSGTIIMTTSNNDVAREAVMWEKGAYSHTVELPGGLLRPGRYVISATAKLKLLTLDEHENVLGFDIVPVGSSKGGRRGILTPMLPWIREEGPGP